MILAPQPLKTYEPLQERLSELLLVVGRGPRQALPFLCFCSMVQL
jgi:hypothetical protein